METFADYKIGNNTRTVENNVETLVNITKLLQHKMSSKFTDRIIAKMDWFLAPRVPVLYNAELLHFIKLLKMLFERYDTEPIYQRYFFKILEHAAVPCTLRKSTELFAYLINLRKYFNLLGYFLVHTHNVEIISQLCDVIEETVTNSRKGRNYLQTTVVYEAALTSDFPVIISELLAVFECDFYMSLLKVINTLIKSEDIGKLFITQNMIELLLLRLYDNWKGEECVDIDCVGSPVPKYLDITIKIVWRLTCIYYRGTKLFKRSCNSILITRRAYRSCRSVFISLMTSPGQRKQRNKFVLMIMSTAWMVPVEVYQLFEKDLYMLAFASETTSAGTWASQVRFTCDPLDFELKLLLMTNMHCYAMGPIGKQHLEEQNVGSGLLRILTPEAKLVWTTVQHVILMQHALIGLEILLKDMLDDFLEGNGPAKLLRMLDLIGKEKLDIILLPYCLRCINTSINVRRKVKYVYMSMGVMDILLVTAKIFSNSTIFTMQIQACVTTLFCVLKKLQGHGECLNPEFIMINISYLRRFLLPRSDDMIVDPHLLIALLDFMREAVRCDQKSIDLFLHVGGIFLLLDIMEKFPTAIKLICLTTLLDLCEISSCIPYILTWRSQKGEAVLQVLMSLFRQQSLLYGVDCTDKCVLGDLENPLMNTKRRNDVMTNILRTKCCGGALEMLGTCELKIYALLRMLGCKYKTDSKLANNCYQISKNNLTFNDKITILVAEHFFELKRGEIWAEFSRALEVDGIRLLDFDQELLNSRIQQYHKLTMRIREAQEFHLEEKERKEGVKEMLLYKQLRDQTLAESLDVLTELDYQGRCVEAMFRIPAKLNMRKQLTSCNYLKPFSEDYHRTVPYAGAVTNVFNQRVSVRSNVVIKLNEEAAPKSVSQAHITEDSVMTFGTSITSIASTAMGSMVFDLSETSID